MHKQSGSGTEPRLLRRPGQRDRPHRAGQSHTRATANPPPSALKEGSHPGPTEPQAALSLRARPDPFPPLLASAQAPPPPRRPPRLRRETRPAPALPPPAPLGRVAAGSGPERARHTGEWGGRWGSSRAPGRYRRGRASVNNPLSPTGRGPLLPAGKRDPREMAPSRLPGILAAPPGGR